MPRAIGTVISSLDGPSTQHFEFVVREDSGKIPAHKGQFVQVKTEQGMLIGRITEIIKTNRYFMEAESVREYEKSGKPLTEVFPIERWEYLIAKATPLGVYEDGRVQRVSYPPSPGTLVEKVDKNTLSDFLGLDHEKGLNIGKVAFHGVDASLNLTKLFQKHLAILATTGFGKSYLVSVLIEELLDRPEELGKPAIVVVDPHGEYIGFKRDEKYKDVTKVFDKNSLSIAVSSLSPYRIMEFLPQMSPVQLRELMKIMEKLASKHKQYGLDELINTIENSDIKRVTKDTIISWLLNLKSSGLFSTVDRPSIGELAKSGQLTILDISDFIRLTEKQMIVTHIARKLFHARRTEKIPPFILILEEAHQFCPEGARKERAISKGIIESIAREGRKFHASLVLVSQRPIQLSTTALSQCNTNIFLRIVNPYDIKHIAESCEGITSDIMDMLPGLRVGEAIITGNAINYPSIIHVRRRRSKEHAKFRMSLEDAILSFNRKVKMSEKDIDAFM